MGAPRTAPATGAALGSCLPGLWYLGATNHESTVYWAGIEVVAVDFTQAKIARQAFAHFGKGRHLAGLNYGDCFAYALARQLGEPLLCKGDDFSRTDLALS